MAAVLSVMLLGSAACAGAAKVAIFSEPGFPFYMANATTGPEFADLCLREAGVEAELVGADQLADPAAFSRERFALLLWVYGNTFPVTALENLKRFRAAGGSVVALGGVPFCHPCVREDGNWVDLIESLGWEFVSHRQMGTGIWGDAVDCDGLAHAADDPLGLAWLPLPHLGGARHQQFPRTLMSLEECRAAGYDYPLGPAPEDVVIPVVSVTRDGEAVGHPVCIIEHHCPEFSGAVDVWAGTTLSPLLSIQFQRQLLVASCAYVLERLGAISAAERQKVLASVRSEYVAPVTETAPGRPFILRSAPLADRLLVLDTLMLPAEEQMAAQCLQGIVNRRQPRIFLLVDLLDTRWLDLLCEREGCTYRECESLDELVGEFRGEVKGAIVYDPGQPHSVNIATMVAGLRDAVMATPALADRLGLPVVEDLRGRFSSDVQAYTWAMDHLRPELNHQALACMEPTWVAPRDYLVQHRLFTFWLDCRVSQPLGGRQALLLERILAAAPVHAAVYGWWQHGDDGGIGEWRGVHLSSQFGKITVCTVGANNLSVHSGVRLPGPLKQRPIQYGSLDRKVYVTFVLSDGDNFGMNLYPIYGRLWEQLSRGAVPMGWGICPTQVELTPAAVEYWYRTASDQDLFVAMDGLGYVYPDVYGAALGGETDWYAGFLERTAPFLEALDQHLLWFLGGTSRVEHMVSVLGLEGVLGEYGVPPKQRQEIIGKAAALWADVNPWESPWDDPSAYVERIRARTPESRPAFLFVGVNGFHIGPDQVGWILQKLGPEYVAVRPDELCALYRRYVEQGVDPDPAPRLPLEIPSLPLPGPRVLEDGTLLVREDDGIPSIAGWYTDPAGTQWVRKRLRFEVPVGAQEAKVYVFVRGKAGNRMRVRVNGTEHTVALETSRWHWASVTIPDSQLVSGENEIWYTGNPDGRLFMAGKPVPGVQHSDYGGPEAWVPLAGELLCYLEVK